MRPAEAHPSRHRQLPAMFKVGIIGFGGGSALIPVMERELVNDRGGLDERAFVQDTVIANITPGALPVKLAALAGVRLGGAWLGAASAFAVALPGSALTVALLAFFTTLGPGGIRMVEGLSLGVTAFILYLLGHYAAKVLRPSGRWSPSGVVIAVAVFALTGLGVTARLINELTGAALLEPPTLSALAVILLALAIVAVATLVQRLRSGPNQLAEDGGSSGPGMRRAARGSVGLAVIAVVGTVVGVLLLPPGGFMGLVALSTVSSFGGGEAYVAVADGFFVAPGIVDADAFYGQVVPVANALPGPILVKIAAGMAFSVGSEWGGPVLGVAAAVVATVVSVASCAAIAVSVLGIYDAARRSRFVRNVAAVILPVVCGLLASTAVAMLHASAGIADRTDLPATAVVISTATLALVVAALQPRLRVPDPIAIGFCALLSLSVVILVGR